MSIFAASVISRVRAVGIEMGWWDAAIYLCVRALCRLVPSLAIFRFKLVAQPVPEESGPLEARLGGLEVREVGESDYNLSWFPRPQSVIRDRFEQGAKCLVAFKGERPVACLWFVLGSYLEDIVRCRFVPGPPQRAAWDFDVYVEPRYRLGRTFSMLWAHGGRWLRAHGVEWTMSRIDAFNTASVRAHARLGARVVRSATFLRIGKWQLLICPGHPFLSLSRSAVPTLHVDPPSK